jgi:hypothetical protein
MSSPTPPSSLRTLFLAEAILKVFGGAIFIIFPSGILRNLTVPPYNPLCTLLVRCLGTQTIAFSVPLFLGARSDTLSREARKMVYWSVLAREGFLIVGLLGGAAGGWFGGSRKRLEMERSLEEGKMREVRIDEEDMAVEESRLRRGVCFWVAELVPFVAGRVWILTQKKEWF